MLTHLRRHVAATLAPTHSATLATSGPAGLQADLLPCVARGTRLYLLLPCTSDHLLNLDYDPAAVVTAAHSRQAIVKVIFENCFLTDDHKQKLCEICGEVRADFVKTSTGYGATGATTEDLTLMRRCSPAHVQVKAAGGVRTFDRLLEVRTIGVTRVGATATPAILDECKVRLGAN